MIALVPTLTLEDSSNILICNFYKNYVLFESDRAIVELRAI